MNVPDFGYLVHFCLVSFYLMYKFFLYMIYIGIYDSLVDLS